MKFSLKIPFYLSENDIITLKSRYLCFQNVSGGDDSRKIRITGRGQMGSNDFYLFRWIMFSRILCNKIFFVGGRSPRCICFLFKVKTQIVLGGSFRMML